MYNFALLGSPIKHSLSPWIHEQYLKTANLKGSYSLIEINQNDSFKKELFKLKTQRIDGFNVTVPYKQTIIPYLDKLDPEADKIGAVNTVVHKNGKWIGYNTDGKGYIRSLESKFPELFSDQTKRILVLGAGGAARGIYYALVSRNFEQIDIANRTMKSAKKVATLKNERTRTLVMPLDEAEKMIHTYDVIIQTTSVGMNPDYNAMILSLDGIKKTSIVSDIVYQPIETVFLKKAQSIGASAHYGHTMLLYQAQYAFEIWTNKRVPINNMDNELQLLLEGR